MIRWATHRPAVVWALAAGVVVSGGVAFARLPLATRAEVEFPRLTINASWSGASPELIETYVTAPIEGLVQGIRGVHKTSSTSQTGSSSIEIELEPHADVALARLAILERIETLRDELPPAARNVQVNNWTPQNLQQQPLMEITVTGPFTPGALQALVEETVVPQLRSVPGVASAQLNGGAENRVTIAYDATRLHQLGIDPSALSTALDNAREVEPLGSIRRGTMAMSVSLHDQPHALEDLSRLPVVAGPGRTFTLGELAVVHPEEDAHGRFYRLNGQTAVSISLYRDPGADAIRTTQRARAAIPSLQALLPPAVRLKIQSDESEDLVRDLRELLLRGVIAFGSVFAVLLISLRSLRGGLLVIASAAIAIAGAALTLYLMHVPANLLTLAGLGMGIGILVQNGLIVVERLRQAENTPAGRAAAARRIAPAVFGATLTTTVVLLPFLYLQGDARAMFTPFAAAFAVALFWSVGTALVFVPAVGRGGEGHNRGWPRLAALYQRMVGATLRWRIVTIVATAVMVAVATWAFIKKVPRTDWGRDFGTQRTTIVASVSFPHGSDPAQVEHMVSELEADAVGQPGVSVVRTSGNALSGSVAVEFTPAGSETDAPWTLSDKLIERAALIGGTENVYVSKPAGAQGYYNSSGSGGSYNQRIRVLGYSYQGVLDLARDLQRRLEQLPRVRDVNINAAAYGFRDNAVSVALVPDREALGRVGATAADYASSVMREIAGSGGAETFSFDSQQTRVGLRAAGSATRDLAQLSDAYVSNPLHAPVRIGDVSQVNEVTGVAAIQRENQQYIRLVTYDFRGPQKLADRTHRAFMQSTAVPAGFTVQDDAGYFGRDDSAKGLNTVFGLGVVLVLLAVALVFDSVWAAAMVFLALPIALAGVVAAFWWTKTAFTREAAVGVILVVGLAVNHSILLIDAALVARRTNGGRLTVTDALHAARDRVTMIVLVTLTTLASLTPMAIGTKSDSLFGAIALATAGGTIAGTLGVMFLLPPMLMGRRRR